MTQPNRTRLSLLLTVSVVGAMATMLAGCEFSGCGGVDDDPDAPDAGVERCNRVENRVYWCARSFCEGTIQADGGYSEDEGAPRPRPKICACAIEYRDKDTVSVTFTYAVGFGPDTPCFLQDMNAYYDWCNAEDAECFSEYQSDCVTSTGYVIPRARYGARCDGWREKMLNAGLDKVSP